MASRPDPFELFAAECGLQIPTEEWCAAPRNVLAPALDLERCVLVALGSPAEHRAGRDKDPRRGLRQEVGLDEDGDIVFVG